MARASGEASGALQNTSPFTNYLSGGITLAGNTTIFTSGGGNLIESGTITDGGNGENYSLTKSGAGTLFSRARATTREARSSMAAPCKSASAAPAAMILGNISRQWRASFLTVRTSPSYSNGVVSGGFYYGGSISGTGSVTQAASYGTLVLNGQNTYSGATNVNNGATLSAVPGALGGTMTINVGTTATSQLDFFAAGTGAPPSTSRRAPISISAAATSIGRLGFLVGSTGNYEQLNLTSGGLGGGIVTRRRGRGAHPHQHAARFCSTTAGRPMSIP
jgi:autotransporter-associated beta strand protein